MSISVGRFYLEYAVAKFKNRYIEGTAAKVEYRNLRFLGLLVQTVCQRSGRRLVYDSPYLEARNLACLLSSLSLRVVEVCRHCDDSLCNLLSEIILCSLFHLLKNHCRYLLRRIQSSVDVYSRGVIVTFYNFIGDSFYLFSYLIVSLAHESLYREDGVFRICDGLPFCRVTYLSLSALCECHD